MENKRTGRQALASVIVVFVLGIALGSIATYVREERVWGSQSIPRHGAMQQFAREANLTPDQQKQIQSIVDDTKVKYRQLYDPLDAQREAIRRDGRGRIRAVLTPDQQTKFDEFIRRLDQARAQQPQQ